LTSGPYALERLLWANCARYRTFTSRSWLGPRRRRKLTAWLAIGGILLTGFLAFNDERDLLLTANSTIQELKVPDLSSAEADAIAAGGVDQVTATAVSARYTVVLSATPGGGVVLKPIGHQPITIKNTAPVDILVYPPPGAQFIGQKINAPERLMSRYSEDTFVCVTATQCSS
jgi:hypothetical protein